MQTDVRKFPLFASPIPFRFRCDQCFDTGLWYSYANQIAVCPKWNMKLYGQGHPVPNAASEMLYQIITQRYASAAANEQFFTPGEMTFNLARALAHFTSKSPCPTAELLDYFFSDTNLPHTMQLRKFALLIEELRNVWALPVGSRRADPSGYWIITDLEDCKEWLRSATSAPKTQLVTIWRAARAAFPILAGQQEFAYMNALKIEEVGDVD